MSDEDNVRTLPARQGVTRSAVETLVDALNAAKDGGVEHALVITRDAQGYLDIEWSSMSPGDVCEMAVYFMQHATIMVDELNQIPQRRGG